MFQAQNRETTNNVMYCSQGWICQGGWGIQPPRTEVWPHQQKLDKCTGGVVNVNWPPPQENTQRLCSLLMLLVLSTDNNYAAILIDRFVLLLSDAYCATFMQCNSTFRDFSLPGIFAPRSESSHWKLSLRGAKIPGSEKSWYPLTLSLYLTRTQLILYPIS